MALPTSVQGSGMSIPTKVPADMTGHWQQSYAGRAPEQLSWFTPRLEHSLRHIEACGLAPGDAILDVGGGASTLVDDLLASGHSSVTVLDLSEKALQSSRARLGEQAAKVHWMQGDITRVDLPPAAFALWHDRALLHFLLRQEEHEAYVRRLSTALRPGGQAVIAVFGPDGPTQCSNLPTARYDAKQLGELLGAQFSLEASEFVLHATPFNTVQQFLYARFKLASDLS